MLIGTAALLGAVSCSQTDEPNNINGGLTTVSVNIPVTEATSRAVPEIPEGYKLRCIMQLVDANGAALADARYVNEVAAGSESVDFSFIAPADGYQGAMFWADYVKDLDADYIYTTTDLKAVGYNSANAAEIFNNAAADAFYGYMLAGTKSISLTRPFTRITFKNADAEYDSYTSVKVTDFPVPTSFNTVNGNTDGNATGLASGELTIADGTWFSAYIFVGNNSGANLGDGNDIKLTLGGASTKDITISGADIPLTRNYDITALISATSGSVDNVTVTFPGGMVDPNAPRDIALGDYINADGSYSATFDADKAVGIVYELAANTTENGKEVAAYAFALTNTARTKIADTDGAILGSATLGNDLYTGAAGPAAWNSFVSLAGNDNLLVAAFDTWSGKNKLTGSNLSAWYATSASQMLAIVGTIFNGGEWIVKNLSSLSPEFPARNNAVYTAYTASLAEGATFTHNGTAANFFAGEIGPDGRVLAVQVDEANYTIGAVIGKESNPYLIRPVLTIYK